MRRGWAWVAVPLALSCGRSPSPLEFPSRASEFDEPRQAPGVAVDPAAELPKAESAAEPDQGIVVLAAPADTEAAREMVRAFFRAALAESLSELEKLIDDQAWVEVDLSGGGRERALSFWRTRIDTLDYGALAGQLVYRERDLETYRADDVDELRGRRRLPLSVQGDDVLVRVPITTARTGKTRLFGDELVFLLHRDGPRYRIKQMVEEFRLP